jgi:hypothetical protein
MIATRKFLASRQCLTALSLISSLLLASATAHAETITVTGANGTPSPAPPIPGGVGSDATASAGPGPGPDASNTANASGGNGGDGFLTPCGFFCGFETPGGNGGNSTANATTAITAGAGSASSSAYGGAGGNGTAGGNGGTATATATTATARGGATAYSNASGGAGTSSFGFGLGGSGGAASATARATTSGDNPATASAVAIGGGAGQSRAPILRRSERAQKSVDAVSRTLFRSIIVIIALIFAAAMKSILPLSILITMVLAHRWNRTDPDARAEISDTQAVSLTYQKLKEFTGLEPLLAIGSSKDEAWQLLHHIQNTQNPFAPNKKFFPYLLASITDQFSIRREIARITGARGYRDLMLRDRLFPSIGTLCCHLSPDFALRKAFK